MSEKTTTEYFCDRCGVSIGETAPKRRMTVKAHCEGEWALDFAHTWQDFCAGCQNAVYRFFMERVSRKPSDAQTVGDGSTSSAKGAPDDQR